MASVAFKRALASVKKDGATKKAPVQDNTTADDSTSSIRGGRAVDASTAMPQFTEEEDLVGLDCLSLSDDISAVRLHQLAITLRPLAGGSAGGGGRPRLTVSRWEVRKALLSLCSTPPVMLEVRL